MKSLKEKKMLARLARNAGTPDLALEESIRREEALEQKLFTKPAVIQEEKVFVQELVDDPRSSSGKSLVQQAVDAVHTLPNHKPPMLQEKLRDAEIGAIRQSIADLVAKVGTLSWGGGGTGAVRFDALDDHQHPTDIRVLEFNPAGPGMDPVPFPSLAWNPDEECLDIYQPDNTVCQVGLEQYIRARNDTGSTVPSGKFVRFAGVTDSANPTFELYIADGTIPPLYTIGVTTEDILDGDTGRITTFGKVRGIDTGMWNEGDLLWASATTPGELTNVQPTAPNLAVSVAAVTHSSNTTGVLLVRPTIFPKLHLATFHDDTTQTAAQANTPYAVAFNTTELTCGHITLDGGNAANVVFNEQGLYDFSMRLHFSSTNSSRSFIWIWYRVNGVDVPDSTTKFSIESNGGLRNAAWSFTLSLDAGDTVQIMWAVDATSVVLSSPEDTAFCPSTPSAKLLVKQVNL